MSWKVKTLLGLQVIYLVTGVLAVWLTPGGVAPEERERSITT